MKIDLGMQYEDMEMPMPMSPTKEMPKKHYPSFTYEGTEELDLPEHGTMEIHFHKVASSTSDRDGKKRHTCTVEVNEILEVEAEPDHKDMAPAKSHDEAGPALDKLMEEKMRKKGKY